MVNQNNEKNKQNELTDEPYDRSSLAHPMMYRSSLSRDNSNDVYNDDEIALRNLDGFERTLANAYRLYNLGDELNRKRLYLERKMSNYNTHHRAQQTAAQPKDQSPNQFTQDTALNQHQLKRAIDPIGGANLLKRAVDRIGGGNLLRR